MAFPLPLPASVQTSGPMAAKAKSCSFFFSRQTFSLITLVSKKDRKNHQFFKEHVTLETVNGAREDVQEMM